MKCCVDIYRGDLFWSLGFLDRSCIREGCSLILPITLQRPMKTAKIFWQIWASSSLEVSLALDRSWNVCKSTTNNNSIKSILDKEKLNGSNFLDWYRNLRIVLRNEQKLHHLKEALPKAPPTITTVVVRNAYIRKVSEQQEVASLMLVSMTPEIQKNLEDHTAFEILQELKTIFQQQAEQEMFEIVKAFHACKQEEGQSVSTYVLKMKSYLDQTERLGYPMPLVLRGLRGIRKMNKGALDLYISKSNRADVEAIGSFDLTFLSGMIIMANPLLNHGVNLPDDEQVQPEPVPALLGFAPAVLDIPNNNGWIEEEPKEDSKIEEEEEKEEEMDIEDEMDDPEIIDPYEIEEGEVPPPPADSDTSSDSEPEVKAEDEEEDEAATIGTITRAPYSVQPFSGTTYVRSGSSRKVFAHGPIGKDVDILHRKVKGLAQQMFERANAEYSTLKRLGEMDRYLGGISMERRSETREHQKLKKSVSTLEDQMRGLMLEDKEEKERLKKKLRASQQEKEKIKQAFRHVIDWIRKQFGVEIPPCMGDDDATTPDNAHPYELRGSPYDS
nr:zinc finger, CCHC-type [Tanacetum cinerariifolium]